MFESKNCKNCGFEFYKKSSQSKSDWFSRIYCSKSCAAKSNNRLFPKRIAPKFRECFKCRVRIEYNKRRYCDECRKNLKPKSTVIHKTKKELFKSRRNWQSARTSIRRIAQVTIEKTGIEKCCYVCGYSKHVHICHKKSVSSFDNSATVQEINNISNLVYLCPNHHWELDNMILTLPQ